MKQTAVEWLAKELYEKFEMKGDGNLFDEFLKQAKEMEYKQLEDSFINGGKSAFNMMKGRDLKTFEEYYEETFKTK